MASTASNSTIRGHHDNRSPEEGADQKAHKIRRVSRACDYCHKRSIRCGPCQDLHDTRCQNCYEFAQPCTYARPMKRRGAKTRLPFSEPPTGHRERGEGSRVSAGAFAGSRVPRAGSQATFAAYAPVGVANSTGSDWQAPELARPAAIADLVELYFEIVYPIFPFFHRSTFLRRVSHGDYLTDRFFFASTMAACALTSARARDGAIISSRWKHANLGEPTSQIFHDAARTALPIEVIKAQQHDCLRAEALLALTALQDGQIRTMHQHLGRYHALVAMDGLHDEVNWQSNIGLVETEERRRLFWSMYAFDIYTAVVWDGTVRVREAQCNVRYPSELDDDMFDSNSQATISPRFTPDVARRPNRVVGPVRSTHWLHGWNFVTDLYKVMEHAVDSFRTRRARLQKRTLLLEMFGEDGIPRASQASVLQSVMDMYAKLPNRFKHIQPIAFNAPDDRFGFQAANIKATMQLLRMVLFSDAGASVADRCGIANEVIEAFMGIPTAYLKALSTPLLYHLASIGTILSTVYEEPLSETDYFGVRFVLLSLAQLLSNLDTAFPRSTASDRLRAYVARVDDYMDARRTWTLNNERDARSGTITPATSSQGRDSATLSSFSNSARPSPGHGATPHVQPPNEQSEASSRSAQFPPPQDLLDDWPSVFAFAQVHRPHQTYAF